MSKSALLVIDVQTGMIDGEGAVYQAHEMLDRIYGLILKAQQAKVPVVYVQHDEAPEYDGVIHPRIAPRGNEPVVHKMQPDAFHETDLQKILDELGVESLVVAGFQTDFCVNATSRQAHQRGYGVTIVQDAHSTTGATTTEAQATIADYNQQFASFAGLVPADAITFVV
jgi:nicotinamidase-related amidase